MVAVLIVRILNITVFLIEKAKRLHDPWKYLAFIVIGIVGYAAGAIDHAPVKEFLEVSENIATLIIVSTAGLITGFIIDQMLPVYVDKLKEDREEIENESIDMEDPF